jgi:hypothetical protein
VKRKQAKVDGGWIGLVILCENINHSFNIEKNKKNENERIIKRRPETSLDEEVHKSFSV